MQFSDQWISNLKAHIPGGVNSPVRAAKNMGVSPLIIEEAKGDQLIDVDGKRYIDYCCSWGALICGHAHSKVLASLEQAMRKGTSFGISSPLEAKLASKVVEKVPSIEKVRFVSSGTEATMSAVRLARGYTKRDLIVKFDGNYHGHADGLLVKAGSGLLFLNERSSSAGVPESYASQTVSLPYNDVKTCRAFLTDHFVAAVIVEPIAGNMGVIPATQTFLNMLREETAKQGALLIFDEVISGFRVAPGGAQELYGISPDLTCLGKIIGGGLPAAAFGGKSAIMDHLAPEGAVYQAGTLSGNPLAMAAGYQMLLLLDDPLSYAELERKAKLLTDPIAEEINRQQIPACLQRVGSMFTLFFGRKRVQDMVDVQSLDTARFAGLFRHLLANGIYIPPSQHEAWFISLAHEEVHLARTRDAILEFLRL